MSQGVPQCHIPSVKFSRMIQLAFFHVSTCTHVIKNFNFKTEVRFFDFEIEAQFHDRSYISKWKFDFEFVAPFRN